jgi:putative transcriptional regulator
MIPLNENIFLIADPFLKDLNFKRSVVFICEHNDDGSFGLVQNDPTNYFLHQLFDDISFENIPVYKGGPVGLNTIHFLHQFPFIPNCVKLSTDLYWGGDIETITGLINSNQIDLQKIKFFVGYSGWSPKQLAEEMSEKTWLISEVNTDIIFKSKPNEIWKDALKFLGGEFEQLINYPIDPQLN